MLGEVSMADITQVFGLDLDTSEFLSKAKEAADSLGAIGDPAKMEGLGAGLLEAVGSLAALGVAAEAVKVVFNEALAGEKIEQQNALFDQLAESVGLVGDTLKTSMIDASQGMLSTDDATKAANTAMMELGSNAAKIPQIMALATTYSAKFGGDVTDRFNQLSQAIASGSTKQLKHMGI